MPFLDQSSTVVLMYSVAIADAVVVASFEFMFSKSNKSSAYLVFIGG